MNKRTRETRRYDVRNDAGKWLGTFILTHDGLLSVRSEYGNYSYWWHSIGREDFRVFLLECDNDYLLRKLSTGQEYDGDATKKRVKAWLDQHFAEKTRDEKVLIDEDLHWQQADFTSEFGMHVWLHETTIPNAADLVCRRTSPTALLFAERVWPLFCADMREEIAKEAELKKTCYGELIATIQVIGDSPEEVANDLRYIADRVALQGPIEQHDDDNMIVHVRPWSDRAGEYPLQAGKYWAVGFSDGEPGDQFAIFARKDLAERLAEGKPLFDEDEACSGDMCVTRARLLGTFWNSFDPDPEDANGGGQ